MSASEPPLPSRSEWEDIGVLVGRELHDGKQSRVFAATRDGHRVAVKLTDARLADQAVVTERMRVAEAAAAVSEFVVAPIRIDGVLVRSTGDWLVTVTPFVDGPPPDLTNADDVRLLGRTLAVLHAALAQLSASLLPPVAALDDAAAPADLDDCGDWQLLHGDFSDRNTIMTQAGPKVIDFDDCGRGPVTYDVANSLYMVLFDAEVNGRPESYEAFRPGFLAGYAAGSNTEIDRASIDAMIDTRIDALGRWLDDLSHAPIGIRTASDAWHRTLRAFIDSRSRTDPMRPRPTEDDR